MSAAVKKAETARPAADQTLTFRSLNRFSIETGISHYMAKTYAVAGRVRVRCLPGQTPTYCVEDGFAVLRGER